MPLIFLTFHVTLKIMKQTVTLEIENLAVMQILRSMAEMSLVKISQNSPSNDDLIIAQINEVCKVVDTSVDPCVMAAQMEVIEGDDW